MRAADFRIGVVHIGCEKNGTAVKATCCLVFTDLCQFLLLVSREYLLLFRRPTACQLAKLSSAACVGCPGPPGRADLDNAWISSHPASFLPYPPPPTHGRKDFGFRYPKHILFFSGGAATNMRCYPRNAVNPPAFPCRKPAEVNCVGVAVRPCSGAGAACLNSQYTYADCGIAGTCGIADDAR